MNLDDERASLLAELERLSDARFAQRAADASIEFLRWDVAARREAEADIRRHGHLGATWSDDRGTIVP
jgi:hypothetical protein